MPTRRDVLKGLGAVAVAGTAVGSVSAAAYDEQPEFVTLEYDGVQDELRRYRPLLDATNVAIRPSDVYAWKATSQEQSTVMYCYWVFYSAGQEGVSEADSHVPDREPVYVEVDPPTGEVRAVHYDEYHYKHAKRLAPPVYQDTHPSLKIVEPWHPYQVTRKTSNGELFDLSSMHAVYEPWLANDWEVHQKSVVNPWTVQWRGHWWPDGSLGISFNGIMTRAAFGVKGALGVDPLAFTRDT